MTFTKEKLQKLDNAIYDTIQGMNIGNPHPYDVDLVVEAATALPKYIAALEEAEKDLILLMKDLKNEIYGSPAQTQSEEHVIKYVNSRYGKAITTIRKMKGE